MGASPALQRYRHLCLRLEYKSPLSGQGAESVQAHMGGQRLTLICTGSSHSRKDLVLIGGRTAPTSLKEALEQSAGDSEMLREAGKSVTVQVSLVQGNTYSGRGVNGGCKRAGSTGGLLWVRTARMHFITTAPTTWGSSCPLLTGSHLTSGSPPTHRTLHYI